MQTVHTQLSWCMLPPSPRTDQKPDMALTWLVDPHFPLPFLSPLVPHLLGLSAVSSTRCKCGAACEARLLVFCGHELVLAAWFVMSVDEMGPLASGDFDQVSSCQLAPLCGPSGPLHPLAVIDCLVSTSCCCFRGHISGFNAAIRLEY